MPQGPPIATDNYGRLHQILSRGSEHPHPTAERVPVWSTGSAQALLHTFNLTEPLWQSLSFQLCESQLYAARSEPLVAKLVQGRLRIYRLPRLRKLAVQHAQDKGLAFLKGPSSGHENPDFRVRAIGSLEQARALVMALPLDDPGWQRLLEENALWHRRPTTNDDPKAVASEALADGSLVAYEFTHRQRPPRQRETGSESASTAPAQAPASLGPHVDEQPAVTKVFKFLLSS